MSEPSTVEAPMPGETTPSTEIQRRVVESHAVEVMPMMTDGEIRTAWRTANALAQSRMFKDAHQAEQAFAKILIGRDLGISATQSLMAIDLVKGAIQLRGVLLASFVQKHPDYSYKVIEKTHEKARVLFLGYPQDEQEEGFVRTQGRWWEVLGEEEFTVEDAKRAGLVKTGGAWEAHPKNMCFWRAISNGVKTHAPELLGGMPVYVEGELDNVREQQPAYGQAASSGQPRGEGAAGAAVDRLPDRLAELVKRAQALDASVWRTADVLARLPEVDDETYIPAVDGIVAEVERWLAEHEPPEAEVVDGQPAADAELEPTATEGVDVAADLQQRWDTDAEWRAQVEPLLSRYVDLENGIDEAVGNDDEATAEHLRDQFRTLSDELDALGVPGGWWPERAGDDDVPTDF